MPCYAVPGSSSSVQELLATGLRAEASMEHVLIIEDQAFIAMLIEDYLRGLGYSSFAFATNVEEAVSAAEDRCPELITADVRLSPGCGIDAVERICSLKAIPVLYITATSDQVRQRCPGAALISKPFSTVEFLAGVRAAYTASERMNALV